MSRTRRVNRNWMNCVALLMVVCGFGNCIAWSSAPASVPLNPALDAARWHASWIASANVPGGVPGVFYFRKEISLSSVPAHFWVHVSADKRFLLHVNGKYAAEGPARGDLFHWRFETVDLAPLLQSGRNVIAAVVWNFGELAPVAQMSNRTGFLMQGNTEAEASVNTAKIGRSSRSLVAPPWGMKARVDTLPPVPPKRLMGACWIGPGINRKPVLPVGKLHAC